MATASSLLTQTEAAIEALLTALASEATQEYSYQGRSWKRADFPRLLDSLYKTRETLKAEIARGTRRRVRVGATRGA